MDITVLIGFIIFSFTCSIVYIINDVGGIELEITEAEKNYINNENLASKNTNSDIIYFIYYLLL